MEAAGDISSGNHHQTRKDINEIPKGCLVILVGQREEAKRFVVPVAHLNHPRFVELLNEAEEEFGFTQSGPIVLPCNVEEFRIIQELMHKENNHLGRWFEARQGK